VITYRSSPINTVNTQHYMAVVRKWGEDHINKSLKQIDANTWFIGGLVLHRSPCPSDTATWNDDGDNSSYTPTKASTSLPSATTPPDSLHIKLVDEAGDASAVNNCRLTDGGESNTRLAPVEITYSCDATIQVLRTALP